MFFGYAVVMIYSLKFTKCAIGIFILFPMYSHATALHLNKVSQKIFKNNDGWVYKYRVQVTNPSSQNLQESVPHYISVRGDDGEIPFASTSRHFFLKGTAAKVIDVYIKDSDIKGNTSICAFSDVGGPSLGSCAYLPRITGK